MNTTVTLDKAGRVLIPKSLRDELHLEPGDALELESEGERVTLRPVRAGSSMRKEQGAVFRGNKKLAAATTDKVLQNCAKTATVTTAARVREAVPRYFHPGRHFLRRARASCAKPGAVPAL